MKMEYFLGIRGIQFIWNGTNSDPEIGYKGYIFNAWDVQEGVEEMYESEVECGMRRMRGGWQEWGARNPKAVKALLDDYIWTMELDKPKRKKTTRRSY